MLPTPPITSVTDIKTISTFTSSEYGVRRANTITTNIRKGHEKLKAHRAENELMCIFGLFSPFTNYDRVDSEISKNAEQRDERDHRDIGSKLYDRECASDVDGDKTDRKSVV